MNDTVGRASRLKLDRLVAHEYRSMHCKVEVGMERSGAANFSDKTANVLMNRRCTNP